MDHFRPIRILLFHLLCSASLCLYTPTPSPPSQIYPPSGPGQLHSTPALLHSQQTDCSLRIEPPALVVRFGDPVTVNCSYSKKSFLGWVNTPTKLDPVSEGRFQVWTEEKMTQWTVTPSCYIASDLEGQCQHTLPVTVYKPPETVSLRFRGHLVRPLRQGHTYSLQCDVKNVAPAQNMAVRFYRDHTELNVQSSNRTDKNPVNESFYLDHTVSREDHGATFWCEATLQLGPEGPQPPPVVRSHNFTAAVHRSDGQVEAPPTHSSREHAGKPTVLVQSHQVQLQHTLEGSSGAGHTTALNRVILWALLMVHITQ